MEQKVKERMKQKKRIDDHTEHLTQNSNKTSWQISQSAKQTNPIKTHNKPKPKLSHSEWMQTPPN